MNKPFTWWWPSSTGGAVAFWIAIIIPGFTILLNGPFGIINVAFWYLVAVGIRFVFIKANGTGPDVSREQSPPLPPPQEEPEQYQYEERRGRMGGTTRFVFAVLLPIAIIALALSLVTCQTTVFDAAPAHLSR